MSLFAFFLGDDQFALVEADTQRGKYLPEHAHFYCTECGEIWAKRIVIGDEEAKHTFHRSPCPYCNVKQPPFVRHTAFPWEEYGPAFESAHALLDLLTNRWYP